MARELIYWVDAGGNFLNLNDWVNYFCVGGRKGFYSPPYKLNSTLLPLAEGSQFNSVITQERGIDFTLLVKGESHDQMRTLIRDLSYRMDPNRGEGYLKVGNESGYRRLYCRPEGIKNVVDKNTIAEFTLGFTANDPYWYGNTSESLVIENNDVVESSFFSDSFFPIKLNKSTSYSLVSLVNRGDVTTYPVWTIRGPGDQIVLRNLTTRKQLYFDDLTLAEGQVLVIDTRIGIKTIKVDGASQFSKLNPFSSLWNLSVGNNDVNIQMVGSSIDSGVRIDFTARYLTP